jgi:hypothetical protein
MLAGDPGAGEGVWPRVTALATEALAAIADPNAGDRPTSGVRAAVARRLEASLLRALQQPAETGPLSAVTVVTRGAPGPAADPPAPIPTDRVEGQPSWTTPVPALSTPAPAPQTAAAAAPAAVNALGDDHAVVPQIVKAIRLQWKQGLGEAKIRLEPEHLGEVQVSLRVQAGVVTAVVKAENPTVQGWIENRQQELRNALDEQGLRLQRFEVVVDPEGRRQPRETPEGNPLRRLRRTTATEPEFEIEI